jgi:hypothetical protein
MFINSPRAGRELSPRRRDSRADAQRPGLPVFSNEIRVFAAAHFERGTLRQRRLAQTDQAGEVLQLLVRRRAVAVFLELLFEFDLFRLEAFHLEPQSFKLFLNRTGRLRRGDRHTPLVARRGDETARLPDLAEFGDVFNFLPLHDSLSYLTLEGPRRQ